MTRSNFLAALAFVALLAFPAIPWAQGDGAWKELERSAWIADGSPEAARVVYVFTDPNCPFCAKLWADARPWVASGKVKWRHVIVGTLTPTSPGKAAALLGDKNPEHALAAYEGLHAPAMPRLWLKERGRGPWVTKG